MYLLNEVQNLGQRYQTSDKLDHNSEALVKVNWCSEGPASPSAGQGQSTDGVNFGM